MGEIKKQVVESSRKSFRTFRRNQPSQSQPPAKISNVEYDDDEEEEDGYASANKAQEEEIV